MKIELFQQACELHEQNQLKQAEQLYLQFLKQAPNHIDALYNLGILYQSLNQIPEAIKTFKHALKANPDDTSLYNTLGTLMAQSNQLEEAIRYFKQSLKKDSQNYATYNNLGATYANLKQNDKALEAYQKAIEIEPNRPDTCFNLGNLYQQQEQFGKAIELFQKSIQLSPTFIVAYQNLGNIYREIGHLQESIDCYQKVIEINPNHYQVYNNLGAVYREQSKYDSAKDCFEKALNINPNYSKARHNLADLLRDRGNHEEAIHYYESLLSENPEDDDAHMKLAVIYYHEGLFQKSIDHNLEALKYNPEAYLVYSNLGATVKAKGMIQESLDYLKKSIEIKPDFWGAHDNYLFSIHNLPGLTADRYYTEAYSFGEQLEASLPAYPEQYFVTPDPNARIRVGYVSPDFRNHAANYAIRSIFMHHDHDEFEVVCYAKVEHSDPSTQMYYDLADEWHFIHGLDDDEIAQLIHQHGIHLLVDLGAGHTANNQLKVFAQKPAPVQMSLYPVITGIPAIEYNVLDKYLVMPEDNELAREKLYIRELCFLSLSPPPDAPEPAPPPCLKNGYVTFGSFNNLAKVNQQVVELWAKILKAVPNSRLFLKFKALADPGIRQHYENWFAEAGIPKERLRLSAWTESSQHFALYNEVDIALDPFPYNGHTTTCEALWMGVPVITLKGTFGFGRAGLSILNSVGLTDLVAVDEKSYVQLAIHLAENKNRLTELRASIRDTVANSSLCDNKAYTKELEGFYRDAWQEWCQKQEGKEQPVTTQAKANIINPDEAKQYNSLGTMQAEQNNLDRALEFFQKAIDVDPNYHPAYNNLGATYANLGQLDKAQESYEKALKIEPGLLDIRFNLGNLHMQLGQLEEALEHYGKVILQSPLFVNAYLNMGNVLKTLGKKNRAIEYYQVAIALQPNNFQAYNNLGSIYLEQGKTEQAKQCLKRALEINPNYETARRNLANIA